MTGLTDKPKASNQLVKSQEPRGKKEDVAGKSLITNSKEASDTKALLVDRTQYSSNFTTPGREELVCSSETQCWDYKSRGAPPKPPPAGAERDAPSPGLGLSWPTRASRTRRHRGRATIGAATAPRMVVQPQVGAEPLRHGAGQSEAHPVQLPHPGVRSCMEAGDAERSCSGWEAGLPAACPAVVAEA